MWKKSFCNRGLLAVVHCVFFQPVPEGSETHVKEFCGPLLHAVRSLQGLLDEFLFDVLYEVFKMDPFFGKTEEVLALPGMTPLSA